MVAQHSGFAVGTPQLLLLGLLWGLTFPMARLGIDGGASPFLLVLLVLAVASAVMATVAAVTRAVRPPVRSLLQSAALGAFLIAGINLPLYWGLQFATGGAASIVYATAPVISLVTLGAVGGGSHVTTRQVGALGLGLTGVVVLGVASTGGALLVGLFAVAAFVVGASMQGVGAVLGGRVRPRGEGPWGLTFQFLGAATAALVVLPILTPSPAFPVNAATLGSLLYVAVASMAVGYSLFYQLIERVGAVRANLVTFLNPVVALVSGVLAFGERFVPLEGVALALILVALYLLQPRVGPAASSTPERPEVAGTTPATT